MLLPPRSYFFSLGVSLGLIIRVFLLSLLISISTLGSLATAGPTPTLPPIPPIPTVDVNNMIPMGAVSEVIKIFGNLTQHRPYEGAVPLGTSGFDLGLEATLVHMPDDFASSLTSAGMKGVDPTSMLPALPMAKLHIHKGISPVIDVGASGLYYGVSYMLGLDLKIVVFQPEEAPLWALRFNYSTATLDLSALGFNNLPINIDGVNLGTGNIAIGSRTIGVQLLTAQRLSFAEPYLGIGTEWINGQLQATMKLNILPDAQNVDTPAFNFYSFSAFTGVSFRIYPTGIRIALEGAFNSLGMHYFGLVTGLGF